MTLAEYLAQPKVTSVAVARRLGVAHSTVLRWAERRVPADRVRPLAAITGLHPHELRPDLYDPPAEAAA
ncbi:helix-turn-helix domain-containing protein [Paracraurococcus ruber]|uniref:Helix-turn-helix domain-containing protein n=1 Tax=Paracraurococcus ruber TaxID=77675 RepID=A0ABS1CS97_9PROT|nr:YdaS family helix-turn-helix protein [Paracraurococcus ruber]MBK1656867.1 hypothetical protein [Paracraurococcus ruber]TDG33981.1 Rha family transcriptional regulator [Paracraurococcus ruber]